MKKAEKASIGIGYMTLGKGMVLVCAMAKLEHTAQPKNLMSQTKKQKLPTKLSNKPSNTLLFYCQNDNHLSAVIILYYVSTPIHTSHTASVCKVQMIICNDNVFNKCK